MSEIIEEIKLESGKILEIHQDSDPESPRNWENLGTMFCSHKRYELGDTDASFGKKCSPDNLSTDDFNGWDEIEDHIRNTLKAPVCLPLYLMDHSGVSINTTPFGCRWDSGQVGFIYVKASKIRSEYNVKKVTKKIIEKATHCLESEVETYDQYLTGDVYGFKLMKLTRTDLDGKEEREEEDSCYGFYGRDIKKNGILDHLGPEDIPIEKL